ncbi:MAG: phospholipase D family protein [Gemmataceae bacterium]
MDLDYVLIATGATGAYTTIFLLSTLWRWLRPVPSHEVFFSPKGGCTEVVVREIGKARHEVLVLAYSFTSKPIADALLAAKKRGVHVDIVLDHSNEREEHTDLGFFLQEGLTPLVDSEHAIAHNKVMIIDSRTIVTGSFNFTNQAEHENAENLIVLKHYAELSAAYRQNFHAHKAHARVPELKAPGPSRFPERRAA